MALWGEPIWRIAAAAADVLLVAYVIYRVLLLIKGTRAVSVLAGVFLLLAAHLASRRLGLATFDWLIGHFLTYGLAFGLIVVFQDELRRGLAGLGRNSFLARFDREVDMGMVEEVVAAAEAMASRRTGALLVLQRTADLADQAESGVAVDARVSSDLLLSIFHPGSALHDGAAILGKGRVIAARCLLPLARHPHVDRELGTRHQAALGLSEEVDAAVVVVSEERGEVALAFGGRLHRPLDPASLRRFLRRLFAPAARPRRRLLGRSWKPAPAPEPSPGAVEGAASLPGEGGA
ncbi:MAG: diadenylate cyclase CdaA [Myxococcales bacterium]